jgi:hypothetical protein
MEVKIIPIIISSLDTVHARSLVTFETLPRCEDKKMKKIGRRPSEAAIAGSLEIWRTY